MDHTITRRGFVAAGGMTATAYLQKRGVNDRIRVAIVGVGARGSFLLAECLRFAADQNVEIAMVCDLWTKQQDRAAAMIKDATGTEPVKVRYIDQVLSRSDIDGVIIATPDFAHARLMTQALKAGKDVFCEKPMGNVLSEVKEAYATAKSLPRVVQIGTQDFSSGNYQAARDFLRSGKLGKVTRIVLESSCNAPRWRGVPAVKEIKEHETDWNAWLLGHKDRPFDPQLYFEFRLYREFSSGIPDQWMSHFIAGAAYVMDDPFPESVTASGGCSCTRMGARPRTPSKPCSPIRRDSSSAMP